jgi:hypothetical protein
MLGVQVTHFSSKEYLKSPNFREKDVSLQKAPGGESHLSK